MAKLASAKLDSITDEVTDLHPLLHAVLPKLPRVQTVEYHHGITEMGADFVLSRLNDTFHTVEYIAVIAKVGRIVQDLTAIERQIGECDMARLIQGGKKKIRINEIWVVATKNITHGAREKIFHKYSTRKIEFVDGATLERLVDQYVPLAWSRLPIAVGEYLQDLHTRTQAQDRSVSLLISNEAFYVAQDLYRVRDTEYRHKAKGRLKPERVDIAALTDSHRCILIEGGVGSGKSKLLRQLIAHTTVPDNFAKTKVLPVTASYTELMKDHSGDLTALISHRVPEAVTKLCSDSEYLVLIDAFDERRTDNDSEADELNALLNQASAESRIRLVVTTRFLKGRQHGAVLRSEVARLELQPLSLKRTFEFIIKLCKEVNVKNRILEDLKRSPLFRNLPRSPMSAILLARLLNENQQEIPSNITELYSKYSELILGRWDEKKGLQSQKEYQALDAILMRLSRQMIDDQRPFISTIEVKDVFKNYLAERNLAIDPEELYDKMVDRCEIVLVDDHSGTLGLKHRSFAEFFYAKSFIADQSLVIDSRVHNFYWMNTFFFYLGLRKDCPDELSAIIDMSADTESEEWLKIINMSNYLLAGYTTPYRVIEKGVRDVAVTAANLYRRIVTKGSKIWFNTLPRMQVLYLLQLFIRQGYSYMFFMDAIESAALEIEESSILDDETKAYVLFFLNVAYIDIEDRGNEETFDFMLKRSLKALPVDVQLALNHEGGRVKERTALMRKQDRQLRRIMPRGGAQEIFSREWYEQPIGVTILRSTRAREKGEKRKRRDSTTKANGENGPA